jgi:serine/threonine-protein kinase
VPPEPSRTATRCSWTSSLHDPHTIRVFDYGASDDGVAYIAMELLHGEDLGSLVAREGPLDPARCARLGRQVCASLAEAHARGIVHRDVKPENLFVTRAADGTELLKVLDFGIAKVSDASLDATLTQGGWVGGTPAYMAPEVCEGGVADPRSDLYSLGAVLYFMLTGAPPFADASPSGVMVAHVRQEVVPPSRRAPHPVPPPLEAAILRCLAKRPQDRHADARELDESLAAVA